MLRVEAYWLKAYCTCHVNTEKADMEELPELTTGGEYEENSVDPMRALILLRLVLRGVV